MKFEINDKVKLIVRSHLKTSDNMPMLRPPDLVAIDEVGQILSIKSPDIVEVKFRRGSFLIDIDNIKKTNLKIFFQLLEISKHIFIQIYSKWF